MSIIITTLKIIVLVIAVLCVAIFLLFYFGTKHEIVTEGEAYGFSIGMTKKQAFAAAESQYAGKNVYMTGLLSNNVEYPKSHTQLDFTTFQFNQIEKRDIWTFYYKKNFNSILRLTFEDGKLANIYRGKGLKFP